jgi:hypothetical protein
LAVHGCPRWLRWGAGGGGGGGGGILLGDTGGEARRGRRRRLSRVLPYAGLRMRRCRRPWGPESRPAPLQGGHGGISQPQRLRGVGAAAPVMQPDADAASARGGADGHGASDPAPHERLHGSNGCGTGPSAVEEARQRQTQAAAASLPRTPPGALPRRGEEGKGKQQGKMRARGGPGASAGGGGARLDYEWGARVLLLGWFGPTQTTV